jgi:hypothetical protein
MLIPLLPSTSLYFIVSFHRGAVLSAEEPSEKVRSVEFALLATMGRKMKDGGVVDMSLLNGATANPGDRGVRETNVQEFVDMTGASLAAKKDHTVSAGVIVLSQAIFEFRSMPQHMLLTKVEAHYRSVQMISPQSPSHRFSTPSIAFSLQAIVKLLRLSLVLSSFVCIVTPPKLSTGIQSGD